MLEAVLNEAEGRARRVAEIADHAGRPEPRDHARMVAEHVVPEGRQRRSEVLAFVDNAGNRLQDLLRRNDLEAGRSTFNALASELVQIGASTAQLGASASAARAAIQIDIAKVDREISELRKRVTACAAEAAKNEVKARNRAARSAWMWLTGPLGKAIDELVGAIQDGTSTEESARRAIEDLTKAREEIRQIDDTTNSLTLLADGADQLTLGVQKLVNSVATMLGHTQNACDDLSDVLHLELFCRAAIHDLEDMRQDAA